jgi:hypothetical protein
VDETTGGTGTALLTGADEEEPVRSLRRDMANEMLPVGELALSDRSLSLCIGGVIDEESVARARQGRVERGESVNGARTVILRLSRAK